eukprot:174711-Chlamydomonas_euryale.AAC.1
MDLKCNMQCNMPVAQLEWVEAGNLEDDMKTTDAQMHADSWAKARLWFKGQTEYGFAGVVVDSHVNLCGAIRVPCVL